MAWCWTGNKPLPETVLTNTHEAKSLVHTEHVYAAAYNTLMPMEWGLLYTKTMPFTKPKAEESHYHAVDKYPIVCTLGQAMAVF